MRAPPRCVSNPTVSLGAFQQVLHHFDKVGSLEEAKYTTLVVWAFKTHPSNLPAVFDELLSNACDVVGVMHHAGDACSAVCRRAKTRKAFRCHVAAAENELYLPKKLRRAAGYFESMFWNVLSGWLATGVECKVNLALEAVPEWTEKEVLPQWADKSSEDIMLEILQSESKVAMKRKATRKWATGCSAT